MSQLLPLIVFLLCLFAFSGQAAAQSRWKVSAIGSNGRIYYVDEHLIIQSDGNILGWEKAEICRRTTIIRSALTPSCVPSGIAVIAETVIFSFWFTTGSEIYIEQVEIDTG